MASTRKGTGFGGVLPIDHQEIQAWGELSRNWPTPWETAALRRMDTAARMIINSRQGNTSSVSGSVEDASDTQSVIQMFRSMGAKPAEPNT